MWFIWSQNSDLNHFLNVPHKEILTLHAPSYEEAHRVCGISGVKHKKYWYLIIKELTGSTLSSTCRKTASLKKANSRGQALWKHASSNPSVEFPLSSAQYENEPFVTGMLLLVGICCSTVLTTCPVLLFVFFKLHARGQDDDLLL